MLAKCLLTAFAHGVDYHVLRANMIYPSNNMEWGIELNRSIAVISQNPELECFIKNYTATPTEGWGAVSYHFRTAIQGIVEAAVFFVEENNERSTQTTWTSNQFAR
jgi:hypothetical protein